MVMDIGRPTIAPTSTPDDNSRMRKCYPALKKPRLSARGRRPGNQIVFAELLPKSVLIGYAQSGKCNERQASNHADSSVFIRSDNHMINPFEIDHNTHKARVGGSSPPIATIQLLDAKTCELYAA